MHSWEDRQYKQCIFCERQFKRSSACLCFGKHVLQSAIIFFGGRDISSHRAIPTELSHNNSIDLAGPIIFLQRTPVPPWPSPLRRLTTQTTPRNPVAHYVDHRTQLGRQIVRSCQCEDVNFGICGGGVGGQVQGGMGAVQQLVDGAGDYFAGLDEFAGKIAGVSGHVGNGENRERGEGDALAVGRKYDFGVVRKVELCVGVFGSVCACNEEKEKREGRGREDEPGNTHC